MISFPFSSLSKRPGATLAGVFSLALGGVVLLCGAGSVPVENLLPQGAMQGDLNAGGHNLTNAATVSATNVVVSGNLTAPASFTLPFSKLTSTPTTLSGYGISDPIVLTSGSYANPAWVTSLAYSKLSGAPSLATVATSGAYNDLTGKPTLGTLAALSPTGTADSSTYLRGDTTWAALPGGYTLPAATTTTLGGVIVPASGGLSVDGSGDISIGSSVVTLTGSQTLTSKTINGMSITTTTGTLTLGSVNLNAGPGGTLGTAAFTAASAYDASGAASTAQSNAEAASIPIGYLSTDGTMGADSDTKVPSQKAVVTYVLANAGGDTLSLDSSMTNLGFSLSSGTMYLSNVDSSGGLASYNGLSSASVYSASVAGAAQDDGYGNNIYFTYAQQTGNYSYMTVGNAGYGGTLYYADGTRLTNSSTLDYSENNGELADGSGALYYSESNGILTDSSGNLYSNLTAGSIMLSNGKNSPITAAADHSSSPSNPATPVGWLPVTVNGTASWIPYYQ